MAQLSIRPGGLSAFWEWWLRELAGLLPRRWQGRRGGRSSFFLRWEEGELLVWRRRRRELTSLGAIELPPLLPALPGETGTAQLEAGGLRLVKQLQAARGSRTLALPPEAGLLTTDILPGVAETDLAKIMRHRLELITPWPVEQVRSGYRVLERRPDRTLEVLVAIVPRAEVDPVLERLEAYGIPVDGVDLLQEDGSDTVGVNLLEARPKTGGLSLWWTGLLVLLLVAALSGLGFLGGELWQLHARASTRSQYAAALEQRLADLPELRARVDALRQEAGFIVDARQALPSPLVVLEVLSRILPESIWLEEMALEGRTLTISGYAEDAAQVLPIVESSPHFSGAEFRAPSTRVSVPGPGGGTREVERFSLSAQVDPAPELNP